jgi:hypothetical protein
MQPSRPLNKAKAGFAKPLQVKTIHASSPDPVWKKNLNLPPIDLVDDQIMTGSLINIYFIPIEVKYWRKEHASIVTLSCGKLR